MLLLGGDLIAGYFGCECCSLMCKRRLLISLTDSKTDVGVVRQGEGQAEC